MNAVFEKTRELAEAIMASEEYAAMKAAEDKAMDNKEASELMAQYIEHKNQLEELQNKEPDPAALANHMQAMEDIQSKIQEIPDIEALTQARGSFSSLIDQVNQVLRFIITGQMDEEGGEEGCTGSCATCHGCH